MSDNQDYQAGYRGGQFHHGMDRAEYERGKGQKDLEDTLGGGNRPVEVPGVAFTLLLIFPLIWTVYPVLGVTILIVPSVIMMVFLAFKQQMWGILFAFVLGVFSFFPGMKLEAKASQFTVYRWVRGILRIVFSFGAIVIFGSGSDLHDRYFTLSKAQPGALVGGFLGSVIVYLIFQRLDLIYFPALKEIKKMQEQLARGERPARPLLKRMFFGFCWFIPVMVVLSIIVGIALRCCMDGESARQTFIQKYGPITGGINVLIWYLLCLTGKLPGTGKFMFIQRHEEDLRNIDTK